MPRASAFMDMIEEERVFKPVVKIVRHNWPEWGQPAGGFIASTHPMLAEQILDEAEEACMLERKDDDAS